MNKARQPQYSAARRGPTRTEKKKLQNHGLDCEGGLILTSLIQSCCICSAESSQVYCQDHGGYMCIQCAQNLHTNVNIFHAPVMWEPMVNTLLSLMHYYVKLKL